MLFDMFVAKAKCDEPNADMSQVDSLYSYTLALAEPDLLYAIIYLFVHGIASTDNANEASNVSNSKSAQNVDNVYVIDIYIY